MPRERLSMRKIKEVLRLSAAGLSRRQVARATAVSLGAVNTYVQKAERAGVAWPECQEWDEATIFARLFPDAGTPSSTDARAPNWASVHAELRRKHVTRQLLWEEYRAEYPEGYGRTQFFEHYRQWRAKLPVWMRQRHRGGEKIFVDFSGDGIPWIDPKTGERRVAALFVSALGVSQYIFARATRRERQCDWLEGIEHAFEYYGGATEIIVPDQPRSVVKRSSRYDPEVQQTFADFATHYSSCVIPARPGKPRDKAKVENAVLIVQRWIIAKLRDRVFSSVAEINVAVSELLEDVNARKIRRLALSRREVFERVDKPALKSLPVRRFEYADWKLQVFVGLDYHIGYDKHDYSVPYRLARQRVDIRIGANTIEVFHRHERVASHLRRHEPGRTTCPEHMPKSHRRHAERSPQDLVDEALLIGPETKALVKAILRDRPHPEQGYRSSVGLLALARRYSPKRFEAACRRALAAKSFHYRAVDSILRKQLENEPLPDEQIVDATNRFLAGHENVRGPAYYGN